jgi:hypothetical protein
MAHGWHADFASGGMELPEKEMTMPKMSAANRKRIAEMKAKVRRGRVLQAKRTKTPEIPDKILKQLAALNLPPNPWVYSVCLDALMRGAYGAIRLFARYGTYACRHCHKALYASQKQHCIARKRLQASKLRLKLGGWPDIREPMPSKPKWKHKKRYQRLRNQAQVLEAQANQTRFRKQIDIRTFAYHVA